MVKNTYKLEICGSEYIITAAESEEYMQALASEIDEKLKAALKSGKLSITQAAVFTALEFADAAKKATDTADNLRGQLKEYLEDAAKAKSESDFYKREIEKLKDRGSNKTTSGIWDN